MIYEKAYENKEHTVWRVGHWLHVWERATGQGGWTWCPQGPASVEAVRGEVPGHQPVAEVRVPGGGA